MSLSSFVTEIDVIPLGGSVGVAARINKMLP
jgi:hypothetical protein